VRPTLAPRLSREALPFPLHEAMTTVRELGAVAMVVLAITVASCKTSSSTPPVSWLALPRPASASGLERLHA